MSIAAPDDLKDLENAGYEITFVSHARAIAGVDFPEVLTDLREMLSNLRVPIEELIGSGGGEAKGTQRLRKGLAERNWVKTSFKIEKRINDKPKESISHEVDHVKSFGDRGAVALEIEWNNKDPFFDRDLENFKRLHSEGAISLGIVVTRGTTLQDDMKSLVTRFVVERIYRNLLT